MPPSGDYMAIREKGYVWHFTVPANRITKVLYVNEKDEKVQKLKEARTAQLVGPTLVKTN